MNIKDLTIGYSIPNYSSKSKRYFIAKNNDEIKKLLSFNTVYNNSTIRSKTDLPGLYTYYGKKGTFSGSNVFFIDIDTTRGVDDIINNTDKLFSNVPYCFAAHKSASGKLHLICVHNKIYKDDTEWRNNTVLLSIIAVLLIKKIFGYDYFEKIDDEDKIPFDPHSLEWYQQLFYAHNEIKINSYCSTVQIPENQVEYIKTNYWDYFERKYAPETNNTSVLQDLTYGERNEKMCIDRNVKIYYANNKPPMTGSAIRWRISKIADVMFGDKAKQWCDANFYCNEGSIYNTVKKENCGINMSVKRWLVSNGFLKEKNTINEGHYISEYKDDILRHISENKRLLIVAPTGCGKTNLINKYLMTELNAVVIVPFNVTNNLYTNAIVVSSENDNKIDHFHPCVMVWDQAVKYWNNIKDRTLIIDESHLLFTDRTYRESAVRLMDLINKDDAKCVLFTATPTGEADELKCKVIKYTAHHKNICCQFIKTDNQGTAMMEKLKMEYNRDYYDRIIVMDNRNAKTLYEKITVECIVPADEIGYLRASTKNTADFIDIQQTEILKKRLYICTCITFQGLNFKNKDEHILILMSGSNNDSLYCDFVQAIGRIRNSDVTAAIYYNEDSTGTSVADKLAVNDELQNIASENGIKKELMPTYKNLNDLSVVSAIMKIEQYIKDNSKMSVIQEQLAATGYIIVFNSNYLYKEIYGSVPPRMRLVLKKQESDNMKKDILENKWKDTIYTGEYDKIWKDRMLHIMNKYDKITNDIWVGIIESKDGHKLLEGILDELSAGLRYVEYTDEEWDNYTSSVKKVLDNWTGSDITFKRLKQSYGKNIKLRKKMMKYKNDDMQLDVVGILSTFIQNEKQLHTENKSKSGKVGGKKSSPKKRIKDLTTGIIYESLTDFADAYGKSSSWASKHKTYWKSVD